MSFSASWLHLREPYDRAARNPELASEFCNRLTDMPAGPIVDLGGGTGSTARALMADYGLNRPWIVLDYDQSLLTHGRALNADDRLEIVFRQADLAGDLATIIPTDAIAVTTSALLDLVSETWLTRLTRILLRRQLPFYTALTYDGRMRWRPGDIFDPRIKQLFDRHQHTDKGFGPALGPDAPAALEKQLSGAAGSLSSARSDWTFEATDHDIQTELLQGYAKAALETAPEERRDITDWHRQRMARLNNHQSRHIVGHVDQLWVPERS